MLQIKFTSALLVADQIRIRFACCRSNRHPVANIINASKIPFPAEYFLNERELMKITIEDDFDLNKIMCSGQAFRIKQFENGAFRFITCGHILYITPECEGNCHHFDISMISSETDPISSDNKTIPFLPEDQLAREWQNVWAPYFDLSRNYSVLRSSVPANDKFLNTSVENGIGLRILKQDPWEMLITFIISQRKNIPAIKESVEKICRNFGQYIKTPFEELYLFPSAGEMKNATLEELKKCSLGYRDTYILDAVNQVNTGRLDLEVLRDEDYETLFEKLKEVRGVGMKVSNCICLFAYAKTEAAPVDTWIAKVIDKFYDGVNPFPAYGNNAGIMQQYIFYYAQTHKDEF